MHWIVDRIEEGRAVVLENVKTQEILVVPRRDMPRGVKSGDALIKEESHWIIDEAETSARAKRINDKWNKLKRLNS